MSRQITLLLSFVVLLTAVAMLIAVRIAGLRLVPFDFIQPGLICAGLSAAAYWYRKSQPFYVCLVSLTILVAFSTVFVVLTYALGSSRWPLADGGLKLLDSYGGLDAQSLSTWMNSIPALQKLLWYAYFSILPQTMLLVIVLGLQGSERLGRFLFQFILCAWVTAICYYFLPALGACGDSPPDYYQKTFNDAAALHNGDLKLVTWRDAQGLITFPSFHVIWGVLIVLAFRWWPITLLNIVMFVSTVPIGQHYVIDLLGGFLVCGFVVPIANRIFDRVERGELVIPFARRTAVLREAS